jgi:uncharacterized protein (DUF2147 family)
MRLVRIWQGLAAAVLIGVIASAPGAGAASELTGHWATKDGEALLDLRATGGSVRVVLQAVAAPLPPASSGAPELDHRNPDEALRRRPLAGLELGVLEVEADRRRWRGRLYDPASGETYSVVATLVGAHVLEVRGFVGLQVFGRTMHWLRLPYHQARVQALWAQGSGR